MLECTMHHVLLYSDSCLYWRLAYIREGIFDLRIYISVTSLYPRDWDVTLTFTQSTKNKIHFPPLYQEPSFKQRGDLIILPFLVIDCWSIVIFFTFKQRIYMLSIFLEKQEMTTLLGTTFSTDEQVVAQGVIIFIGRTVESLIVEFD